MKRTEPIGEAFSLVCNLMLKRGIQNAKELPEAPVIKVGNWTIAANAKDFEIECAPEGCMPVSIPQYHLAVWWNGWLAGLLSPYDGVIAAGTQWNEGRLIRDLKTELKQ